MKHTNNFNFVVPIYHNKIVTGAISWLDNNLVYGSWRAYGNNDKETWDFYFKNPQDAMLAKLIFK